MLQDGRRLISELLATARSLTVVVPSPMRRANPALVTFPEAGFPFGTQDLARQLQMYGTAFARANRLSFKPQLGLVLFSLPSCSRRDLPICATRWTDPMTTKIFIWPRRGGGRGREGRAFFRAATLQWSCSLHVVCTVPIIMFLWFTGTVGV